MAFADLIDIVDRTAKSLLGGELIVKDATLTKSTPGTRAPDAQSAGTNPTTTTHACRAFVDTFDSTQIDGTLIKTEDRIVSIFASTIVGGVTPVPGDKITIEGDTYRIVGGAVGTQEGRGVGRDPASFLYICHGRK